MSSKSSTSKNSSASSGAPSKHRWPPRPMTIRRSHRRRFFVAWVTTTTARDSSASDAQQPHHARLEARVEAGRRLVEEQQARAAEQLGRHAGALALTAGERPDARVRMLVERQLVHHPLDARLDVAGRGVARQPQAGRVAERLAHGEARVHDLVLRDVADVRQPRRDRLAADGHRAARGARHAGQRLDQRRLAGPALADHDDELVGLDAERRLGEDLLALHAHGEALGIEPERAALVAGEELGAVEEQPVGPDADLRAGDEAAAAR